MGKSNLISKVIPSVHQGVSQQDASLRLESQCALQLNGMSSVSDGCRKRPPTNWQAQLLASPPAALKTHMIIRDQQEKYEIMIGSDDVIYAFDLLTGNRVPVKMNATSAYYSSSDPVNELVLTTIADNTFILNKTKVAAMDTSATKEQKTNCSKSGKYEGFVYLSAISHGVTYTINVNGVAYTRTMPVQNLSTPFSIEASDILTYTSTTDIDGTTSIPANSGLKLQIAAAGYTVDMQGSLLRISRSTPFTLSVEDSIGNHAMEAYMYSAQDFNKLPSKCWEGARFHIPGANGSKEGGFYVEYTETDEDGDDITGVWKESRGFNIDNHIDSSTLPHKLESYLYDHSKHSSWGITTVGGVAFTAANNGDPFFIFKEGVYTEREVGDDVTSLEPSFIGLTIDHVFFYRNRLGFLAGNNIILSKAGDEYEQFFPTTVTKVLDGDPIDFGVSGTKAAQLKYAVGARKNLYIFGLVNQFIMNPEGNLTPYSADADPTTAYEIDKSVAPITIGKTVMFLVSKGDYTGAREFVGDIQSDEAIDVTEHVPQYIPRNIFKMEGSANEDVVLMVSSDSDKRNSIIVNKCYWVGEEKAQNSWSEWQLDSGDEIIDIGLTDARIYLIIQREGEGICEEYINLKKAAFDVVSDSIEFQVHLDKKVTPTASFNSVTQVTTLTYPYPLDTLDEEPQVILGDEWTTGTGSKVPATRSGAYTMEVFGDYTDHPLISGVPYTFRYRLSIQYLKESVGEGRVAVLTSRVNITRLYIKYTDSGKFRVEITPEERDTSSHTRSGIIGSSGLMVGRPSIGTGVAQFPVNAKASTTQIDIVADDYLPMCFQSFEWIGRLRAHTTRRY